MWDEDQLSRQLGDGYHYHNSSNYTITTSVSIRVTPRSDYFVSWSILWFAFVIVSIAAFWQAWKERWVMLTRRQSGESAESVESNVSTADATRTMFRRLLLVAMLTRVILMPVQIYADPIWWQFVSDTLPEMIFASAWSLLVTFFVQLVGIATGTGTDTSPGIVIQATAYCVYLVLIITQLFNNVASVLLYALLCCIYAALFGTVIYFCPRLLSLLHPSLVRHQALTARLTICTVICIGVFAAHIVGYARLVVAPPRIIFWWWNYGALELIPSMIFLIIMHPSSNKVDRDSPQSDDVGHNRARSKPTFRRSDSNSSNAGAADPPRAASSRRAQETTGLLKGGQSYGTTSADSGIP